jgi:hypothetical protein
MQAFVFDPDFQKKEDLKKRALVNKNQIDALSRYMCNKFDLEEITNSDLYLKAQCKRDQNTEEVFKYLRSAWNTEKIMAKELELLKEQNIYYMTQWLFPQAYYATFSVFLAFLKAVKATEVSHTAVLKKYSEYVKAEKLPMNLAFYSDGIKGNIAFGNIQCNEKTSSLAYNDSNDDSIANQICQFLKSTREIDLDSRKKEKRNKFITKTGGVRKSLAKEQWQQISSDINVTSLLHLLYRKRIKANYQDVETFECPEIAADVICEGLLNIIKFFSITFEIFIGRVIGKERLFSFMQEVAKNNDSVGKRLDWISKNAL